MDPTQSNPRRAVMHASAIAVGVVALVGLVAGIDWFLGGSVGASFDPTIVGESGRSAKLGVDSAGTSPYGIFFLREKSLPLPAQETGVPNPSSGQVWSRTPAKTPKHLVVLVHGLDEPGTVWDELAPALAADDFEVARFEYPNDQAIGESAAMLYSALMRLRKQGVESVDLVGHSMGGLVSRDVLTRATMYNADASGSAASGRPAVEHFVTIGTPNAGSDWAKYRWIGEAREQAARLITGAPVAPPGSTTSPGRAGFDLLPGSVFLKDLNARGLPRGVATTIILGRMMDPAAAPRFGTRAYKAAANSFGDGVVAVDSARLEGVDDVVELVGNHRTMLVTLSVAGAVRTVTGTPEPKTPEAGVPAAIPVIVERLRRPVKH